MNESKWAPKPETTDEKARDPGRSTDDVQQQEVQISSPTASSLLSAAAPSFSPAGPPPETSSVDYFEPTGAQQDELFDDATPVDDSMRVRSEDDLFSDDFTPVAQPVVEPIRPQPPRDRGDGPRGRGRGRGRGAGGIPARGSAVVLNTQNRDIQANVHTGAEQDSSGVPENAPTGPKKEAVSSVRGDRQATGGVRKPKLTEQELADKMARIQVKNASLTAAHARAEADAASFAEREEHAKQNAAQKQKVERRDRQQMMGERERNRMRKLKAMEGREWDAEKSEGDFSKGGRFDKKGNFAGDQEDYTDGREYLYHEPRGGGRGRGRGDRGGRTQQQVAPKQEEFPALPLTTKSTATPQKVLQDVSTPPSKSWADQVESSNVT